MATGPRIKVDPRITLSKNWAQKISGANQAMLGSTPDAEMFIDYVIRFKQINLTFVGWTNWAASVWCTIILGAQFKYM